MDEVRVARLVRDRGGRHRRDCQAHARHGAHGPRRHHEDSQEPAAQGLERKAHESTLLIKKQKHKLFRSRIT